MFSRTTAIAFVGTVLVAQMLRAAVTTVPSTAPIAPITLTEVTNPDDIVFMFPVSRPLHLVYQLKNATGAAIPLTANFSLVNRRGEICGQQQQPVVARDDGTTPVDCTLTLSNLPFGQYVANTNR